MEPVIVTYDRDYGWIVETWESGEWEQVLDDRRTHRPQAEAVAHAREIAQERETTVRVYTKAGKMRREIAA